MRGGMHVQGNVIINQSFYVEGTQPLLLSLVPNAPACEMDARMDTFPSGEHRFSFQFEGKDRTDEEFIVSTFSEMANPLLSWSIGNSSGMDLEKNVERG